MPAPRFYVDAPTAIKQYNLYKKGHSRIHNVAKRKMYAEIFSRFEQAANARLSSGQYILKYDIMEKVLEQEAPSFYYEDDSALITYYNALAKKRRKLL